MTEREPDYEDNQIRAWRIQPGESGMDDLDKDRTRLCVDWEAKDVLESRTYRFEPGMSALSFVLASLARALVAKGEEANPLQFTWNAICIVEDTRFQFFAKRRKHDGRVTYLLVASAPRLRQMIGQGEWIEEWDYREAVAAFESHFPSQGVLAIPRIVGPEDWQRFREQQLGKDRQTDG